MKPMLVHNPDDPKDDPRWKLVTCTRCGESYQCTPLTDFMQPAPKLNWTAGKVCEPCLIALAIQVEGRRR